MKRCGICKKLFAVLNDLPDEHGFSDGIEVCDSCLVAGVAEGYVHLNPEATERAIHEREDREGEEWKS